MILRLSVVILLVCLAGCAPPAPPPDPALWGTLQPGPYRAGFGLRWETDPSRTYGPDKKPRPIPIGVWYPALKSSAPQMQMADYFDIRNKQVQFDDLATRLNKRMHDSLGDMAEHYLGLRAYAVFDAPSAKGPFPVVIYHDSDTGSYAENSVLFEYLATRGYIVLSTTYHCEDAAQVAPCPGTASIRDMLFLHRFAAALATADPTRVAAIGQGEGAQAMLSWAAELDSPLAAVVAIDPRVAGPSPTVPTITVSRDESPQRIGVFLDANLKKAPR